MKSETPLDYAVFNLSPRRSRCELLVTSDGTTEKLASGLLKPFVTHLKVAEEQVALAVQSIKLEADKSNNAQVWFTKGTLERFVRFVSTPEVLELVNTFDIEMSQLEAARKIYSQSAGDHASGGDGMGSTAAADATKKELLRAIDVRLVALKQDLTTACARASAAGFNPHTVSGLQRFANHFGAARLNEACSKSLAVWQRRPDLITWKPGVDDSAVRSSTGSDMSIDDPIGPESNVAQAQAQPQEQRQQTRSLNAQHSASASESDAEKEKQGDSQSPTESSIQKAQPGRRLSVQDRINLFESKQKENSGGKPVVAKPAELRRLSSDVSSGPGPAVFLRRWSGASDMSIDVTGAEKKDTGESPLCTPSSSSSVSLPTSNIFLGSSEQKGVKLEADSHAQNQSLKENKAGSKGPANGEEQQGSGGTVEQVEVNLHVVSSGDVDSFGGIKDQAPPVTELKPVDVGVKNQDSSQTKIGSSGATAGDVEETQQRHQRLSRHVKHPQSHFRSLSGQLEGGFGLKFQDKDNNGDSNPLPQPQWKSLTGVGEEARHKDSGSSEKQAAIAEDSGVQRMKFQKPTPGGPEQVKKYQGRREESRSLSGSSKPGVPGTKVLENEDIFGTPVEQGQRVRQSKGNQEANDELKMKANELEKLFAEHKLRAPADQSGSARRGKPADTHLEQQPISSEYRNPAAPEMSPVHMLDRNTMVEPAGSSSNINFKTPPMKMVDNQDYGGIARSNSAGPGFAFDSRGKFYDRYMQKRNAKLKEEWSSNRVEKEAKMKAMRDNLEQSKAELKAKLSDADNSVSSARRRAEKLRSFNARSSWKREQLIDSMRSEEDDDLSEFLDQKSYGQDKFNETFFSDGGSKSSMSKKSFLPRNMSSSTPRTTAPIPRSNVKPSNSGSGRRKMQVENPLAQSVPNFSDIRKENTKPFSGIGKMTTRSQVRNYTRNKSATEDIPLAKEEKTRRHQSVRKGLASPLEFKDGSPMISDDIAVGQLKEQTEPVPYDTFSRHVNSKPFLRKGTGGAGASISKLKASMTSEMRDEEEFDELPFDAENSGGIVTEEEEEELDNAAAEDYGDMDNGKPSQESDKSGNSGSENGDSVRSLSQVDPASVPELPAPVPSTFHHMGSLQDSPGESPISWNSRMHHPFSYQRETSDIDASVDSPMGSPASWNSHSLAQTDADVARMRKKWGSAQKPILVSNSSHNQSRKDMTKGFKRLLKFGRKKSGTDSLVDWISATTSEGDDDTEDGRDPANRLSDDLRKSRMGFSQGHPSDDGFNDSELFNEQVQDLHSSIPAPPANFRLREDHISGSSLKAPRSFFSLSSFRSKGSDSKPR